MTTDVYLLDGNVLVAIVVTTHEHHSVAAQWFAEGEAYATCPITQGTLLRLLVRTGHGVEQATALLDRLTSTTRHGFWPDDAAYDRRMLRGVQGHRQVTDAYLAQLARRRRGRLLTFDRGLAVTHADVAVRLG